MNVSIVHSIGGYYCVRNGMKFAGPFKTKRRAEIFAAKLTQRSKTYADPVSTTAKRREESKEDRQKAKTDTKGKEKIREQTPKGRNIVK